LSIWPQGRLCNGDATSVVFGALQNGRSDSSY